MPEQARWGANVIRTARKILGAHANEPARHPDLRAVERSLRTPYPMHRLRYLFLLLALSAAVCGMAQNDPLVASEADTLHIKTASEVVADSLASLDWRARHQPARAAIYSAIIPGAGQVYNRKYWKVPIVLGGIGVSYWFIQDNNTNYQRYKTAYLDVVNGRTDEFNGLYSADQLRSVADTYHRWRDLSYVALGLVYVLNIMDASVDAYFVRFDVSDDLTVQAGPSLSLAAQGVVGFSLSVKL